MIEDIIDYGRLIKQRDAMDDYEALGRHAVAAMALPDGVKAIPITSREQWLALRGTDVTASPAGALFGVHPYITELDLYNEKTGITVEDGEMTEAMDRGVEMEPIAVKRLARKNPDWEIWQPNTYYTNPSLRIGATPDCFAIDPSRPGFGSIQIKNPEPGVFMRTWRVDGAIEPPLWIAIQAIVEAKLTGASWCAVAALVIGHGIHLHVIPLDIHEAIWERLKGEVAEFWQRVANGRPPDPDPLRDYDTLASLYAPQEGRVVDLTNDNELPALAEEDVELRDQAKVIDTRRKFLKGKFLLALGDAEYAKLAGGYAIVGKRIKKAAELVPRGPVEYTQITVKEPKS